MVLKGLYVKIYIYPPKGVEMMEMGRLLVVLGVALVVIGAIVLLLGRTGLPLGRLPGDVVYRGKNTTFYFPLASSVLISVVVSIVLFLIGRWKR